MREIRKQYITYYYLFIAIFRNRDAAKIIGLECPHRLSPNELPTIPLFLRFDNVQISCEFGYRLIEEKCKFIESQLLPLKLALYDSNVVELTATVSQNYRRYFSDHSMLLDFIRNRFLPICNSSRRYELEIRFYSDANSDTNVIASILEMDEIKHCSNVKIGIFYGEQKRLPVEEISNWLEPSDDRTNNSLQSLRERFLKIYYPDFSSTSIQNGPEMLEHLTNVYFKTFVPRFFCYFNEF